MMKFRFQSYVDISTSASSMQVLQWSVGGWDVVKRCRHLFGAYKYFKLGKISVKMVPASTLPVDPQGLSYASDDPQTVDPRDQMNPGLVRITNGEDIFTNVSTLSETQQRQMYTNMMLDPRWSKFMLQSGFRRSAYPLYWQVGQLSQDVYPGATINVPSNSVNSNTTGLTPQRVYLKANVTDGLTSIVKAPATSSIDTNYGSPRGMFQVGHRGKLGYLPTDFYQQFVMGTTASTMPYVGGINNVPEVSVITCVLPRAYKTLYYYRVFITEEVYFAGLRSAPFAADGQNYFGTMDNFVIGQPTYVKPGTGTLSDPAGWSKTNGGELP